MSVFTMKKVVATQFTHGLKQFNALDRVRILRGAMRETIAPGKKELRAATPRSTGVKHLQIMARKIAHDWPSTPPHAADAAQVTSKVNKSEGFIMAKLGYKKGFSWYMHFLTHGFTVYTKRGPKFIKGRDFASSVIDKYEDRAIKQMPKILAKRIERALAKRVK